MVWTSVQKCFHLINLFILSLSTKKQAIIPFNDRGLWWIFSGCLNCSVFPPSLNIVLDKLWQISHELLTSVSSLWKRNNIASFLLFRPVKKINELIMIRWGMYMHKALCYYVILIRIVKKCFSVEDLGNTIDGRLWFAWWFVFLCGNGIIPLGYTDNPLISKPEGILPCLHEYLKCFRAWMLWLLYEIKWFI